MGIISVYRKLIYFVDRGHRGEGLESLMYVGLILGIKAESYNNHAHFLYNGIFKSTKIARTHLTTISPLTSKVKI